eukprot:GHUV01031945.1.p1 GENE.GHUV01031945.1~~GHUV01031945.1.p1  ORF type:complete len:148 (+),score=25.93 GHUV01031945.1:96-539(+)
MKFLGYTAAADSHPTSRSHHVLFQHWPYCAVEPMSPCCFSLAGKLGSKVLADSVQESKGDLPAKGLICHHQEDVLVPPQEVKSVLVACDCQLLLICRKHVIVELSISCAWTQLGLLSVEWGQSSKADLACSLLYLVAGAEGIPMLLC